MEWFVWKPRFLLISEISSDEYHERFTVVRKGSGYGLGLLSQTNLQVLADAGCETPAINYRRSNGRKYRCRFISEEKCSDATNCQYYWMDFYYTLVLSFSFRYFYAISSDVAIRNPGRLVKVDTQTSKVSS